MTTVWIRHGTDFGDGAQRLDDGVHHVIDDLESWLAGVVAARAVRG
ncbi:MAG: hypothetical protein ACOC93_06705 [Planctomycetota bacterium]